MLESGRIAFSPAHERPAGLTSEPSVSTQFTILLPKSPLATSTPSPVRFWDEHADEGEVVPAVGVPTAAVIVYYNTSPTTETLARSRACEVPKVNPLA